MTTTFPPMPPGIAALPRDKRGYPVPFISDWTSRSEEPMIAHHRRVGRYADCTCRIGRGEPILGEPCVRRSQEAISGQLCSTCGQDIRTGSLMVWPSLGWDIAPIFVEPANHPQCLAWALRVCPYLVTNGRSPDGLTIVTAHGYRRHQIRHIESGTRFITDIVEDARPVACRAAPGYLYGYAMTLHDPQHTTMDDWLEWYSDWYSKMV